MKHPMLEIACALAASLLFACASSNHSPATRPAELSEPVSHADAQYWFNQPAVATVRSRDFQKLWDAFFSTLINDQFEIDQQDYRLGVMTTMPMVSRQFFEFWRSDAGTLYDVLLDSLQNIRRTVRVDFERQPDGSFVAHPRVVMEQSSHPERRITIQAQYSSAFTSLAEAPNRENEAGESIPNRYWFALGRDEAMEQQLAHSVAEKLK